MLAIIIACELSTYTILFSRMRIISLSPHATEILFALGLGPQLVGCTHLCDQPLEALSCRRVTRRVSDKTFEVDEDAVDELDGDVLFVREGVTHLDVSLDELQALAVKLQTQPQVVPLQPHTIGEAMSDIRTIAQITDQKDSAVDLVQSLAERLDKVRLQTRKQQKPKVTVLSRLDPLTVCGLWVPQLIEFAGGEYLLNFSGERSEQTDWQLLGAIQPEQLLVYHEPDAPASAKEQFITYQQQFTSTKAKSVTFLDGKRFFSEPGPRIIDGLELVSELLHNEETHADAERFWL